MSTEMHIHAFPRKSAVDAIYPDGIAIWDADNKRLYIGDGATVNGIRVAMFTDIEATSSVFLEREFSSLVASGEAGFNGLIYVHHLVAPSGKIYNVESGDCRWDTKTNTTYVKMADYLNAENISVISEPWIAVYNPRPSA
jgi:hypothetical protein